MPETPRKYKERIDEQRSKMRRNRDELIECIQEYELVDEKYKAETKKEILASFEKNEKSEKTGELYVKIGEELANIEQKYKDLEELKEKLESKRNERETLKNELKGQNIDGDDKTTLKMQMQKLKSINSKIEEIDGENKKLEKKIEEREKEIKEIEETYGKKECTDKTPIKEGKEQRTQKPQVETTKKESPKTLQEYKETFLSEKLKIDSIKGKIIELLEEGTGIDESLKEKIKLKISNVFEKYNDEIEGSLRMKSARYMENRESILNLDTTLEVFQVQKNGKFSLMRGNEQLGEWFDYLEYIQEIGGKPYFRAKKDGQWCIMRGNEQIGGWFEYINYIEDIGGKRVFLAQKNGQRCIIRGNEILGDWVDDLEGLIEIGGKPAIRARKNGKYHVIRGNEKLGDGFDKIRELKEIGGKPCFEAIKDGKEGIIRGNEQLGERFEQVGKLHGIGGKPCFKATKEGKECMMRGDEQYSERFDYDDDVIAKMEELKAKSKEENMKKTSREEREKVILDRYQKKLNRDELLKIISRIESTDEKTKKTLQSEIFSDFYTEFKKATSTKEFQEFDADYRELKKTGRKKAKKLAELEKQKETSKPEVEKLDKKLFEITNSAMKLEDDSRLKIIKSKRLEKAKEEWNTLESRLNEILEKVKRIQKEEAELTGIYSEKEKKYGKKVERPEIKCKELRKDIVATEKLEAESTLLGHRNAYMELIKDKKKYIDELLKEIETTDFGISEEKKKDVIEKLKIALEKDLEIFKEGDEITKLANETEKWLKENWKDVMEQISELKGKIDGKEKEISELKSKEMGDDSKEIYKSKEKEFELKDELLDLKGQYDTIKTELEEKLKKYDGSVVDLTKKIVVVTWEERQKWHTFIDMGINPKDLTVYGESLNKPIYIYKDSDDSCTLFRGDKKIRSGITKIIEIKNIGGDIVLKTENSDGYYSVFRGDKECYGSRDGKKDKYKQIYDIHEVDGKPIFLALDSDGYYSIIIGYEKYTRDKAKGYYERCDGVKDDLEKRQYINSSKGYTIISWEK